MLDSILGFGSQLEGQRHSVDLNQVNHTIDLESRAVPQTINSRMIPGS